MQDYSPAGSQIYKELKRLSDWEITTYRSVEGGGTGEEFPNNLKNDYDSPGNKWYDCCSGETWIEGRFREPIWIKKITLQSANDCPERDPYTVSFYANGDNFICRYDHLTFTNRYQKQEFLLDSLKPVESIKIVIESNKSLYEQGNWGSGTQLAQVIFYHI